MSRQNNNPSGLRLVHSVEKSDVEIARDAESEAFASHLEKEYDANKSIMDTATLQIIDLPADDIVERTVEIMQNRGWSIYVAYHKSVGCKAGSVSLSPPSLVGEVTIDTAGPAIHAVRPHVRHRTYRHHNHMEGASNTWFPPLLFALKSVAQ